MCQEKVIIVLRLESPGVLGRGLQGSIQVARESEVIHHQELNLAGAGTVVYFCIFSTADV